MDSALHARPDLLWREVDGEVVLLDPSCRRYYGIEGIGVHVWRLLQRPTTRSRLVERLLDEYHVDQETLRKDLRSFLSQLASAGLLRNA